MAGASLFSAPKNSYNFQKSVSLMEPEGLDWERHRRRVVNVNIYDCADIMNSPHHFSISSHNQHGRNRLSLQSCSTLANKLGPQKRSLSCNPPRFLHRIHAPSQNPTVSRFHLFASPILNSENPLVCHRIHVVNGQGFPTSRESK